ncbi:hypothetical protein [Kribbia dieselivorans]|uniref:hypothetical protein n=1 Tax=Kribbia dieselivorans TaxID=331526 RepID=UPI0008381327|nr:hypothetical protein [Kribbia dieselivorans]
MSDSEPRPPRRPLHFGPDALEAHGDALPGPAEAAEAAHAAAQVLVDTGRAQADPELTARLVALVDELGLDTVAHLWSQRPGRSLPGALWRLYALREWVQRSPRTAAEEYAEGMRWTAVNHAIAGSAEPPGIDEIRELADSILRGVFDGDLAVALDRAAAFCRVISAGRASLGARDDNESEAASHAQSAAAMLTTATDLSACAELWRRGHLV